MLTVKLFGEPSIQDDNGSFSVKRRKTRALIFYIAAHHQPISRKTLIGLLWPNNDDASARHSLSVVLYDLKRNIPNLLVVNNQMISLTKTVEVDAHVFEHLLMENENNLESIDRALSLYDGFLQGFDLPDSSEFSLWKTAESEKYKDMAIRAMTNAANFLEKVGNYHQALDYLKRALELDPLQEGIYCTCMRLHYLSGNRLGAIRQYHKLCQLLKEELGVLPMPQTIELYKAIITDSLDNIPGFKTVRVSEYSNTGEIHRPPLPKSSSVLPFVGRESELRSIRDGMQNGSHFILIEGEPGIGKTRLVEEFVHNSESIILYGSIRELESSLPYQPIKEALKDLFLSPDWPSVNMLIQSDLAPVWRRTLEFFIPEISTNNILLEKNITEMPSSSLLWEAVYNFFRVISSRHKVILIIDDIHLAGSSMLGLLSYLLSQSKDIPLYVVAISHPISFGTELFDLVQSQKKSGVLYRINLKPLPVEDIVLLAQRLSSTYARNLGAWLARESEGNPYYLKEIVQYLYEFNYLTPNGKLRASIFSDGEILPNSIRDYINLRLKRVSNESRHVLNMAAVIGRQFEFDLVSKIGKYQEDEVLDSLDELCTIGLICANNKGEYQFDHNLTRNVVYNEINANRRKLLHCRIAAELEKGDPVMNAGRIAIHYRKAEMPEKAAYYALMASDQLFRQGIWKEGIEFSEQAMPYIEDKQKMLILKNQAVMLIGMRSMQASNIYEKAARLAKEIGQEKYYEHCLGSSLIVADSDFYEIFSGMDPAFYDANAHSEALYHLKRAEALFSIEEVTKQQYLFEHSDVKLALGLIYIRRGNLAEAVRCFKEGLEYVSECQQKETALWRTNQVIRVNLGAVLNMLHDPEAERIVRDGLYYAGNENIQYTKMQFLVLLGKIALYNEDFEKAKHYLDSAMSLAYNASMPYILPYIMSDVQESFGILALKQGNREQALKDLRATMELADSQEMRHQAVRVRIMLSKLLPPEEAAEMLYKAREIVLDSGCSSICLETVDRNMEDFLLGKRELDFLKLENFII